MNAHVVIPLHRGGGKFGDNTELRYAVRSWCTHFKAPFDLSVVGVNSPDWLTGATHLPQGKGLKSALLAAANLYPDGFIWAYDDCCLLKDATLDEIKVTPAVANWGKVGSSWSRKLHEIKDRLVREGRPARDYSRPHGPYWFDKSMIDECFADWPGMAGKFPLESWILSKRDWPYRFKVVHQKYGAWSGPPDDGRFFLNYNANGTTMQLLEFLQSRFGGPCWLERDEIPDLHPAVEPTLGPTI